MKPRRITFLFRSPRRHPEAPGAASGSISEQTPWETALKAAAAPNRDLLDQRNLQRAINPRAAGQMRGTNVPVRMIIERHYGKGFFYLTDKNRGQMMKI